MIIQDFKGSLGSRVTRIKALHKTVVISTAKEGLFKGFSSIVIIQNQVQAKFIYNARLPKKARHKFHEIISMRLDDILEMAESERIPINLNNELYEIAYYLKEEGVIEDYIIGYI